MALPNNQAWVGSSELIPGKEFWEITSSIMRVTTSLTGPYALLKAQRPVIGQAVEGYDFGMRLVDIKLTELDGDAARIDFTVEAPQDASTYTTEQLGASTYTTEWAELGKPLETHGRCGFLTKDRNVNGVTGKQLTWEDWQMLTDNDYDDGASNGIDVGGTWTLAEYKAMKCRGTDSYNIACPIIRRTSYYYYPPSDVGAAVDKIQDPPANCNFTNIRGWQWLGGPDRIEKHLRLFTRSSEWVGAQFWDPLMYQSA